MTAEHSIRVLHLYDEYLNIYADRGNIAVFKARCAWRGIGCDVRGLAPGETFDPNDVDLIYIGGGQDRDQAMIAKHMHDDLKQPIATAVESGVALLAVCGGYQLLGHRYLDTLGNEQLGTGLFDLETIAGDTRCIGNIEIEATLPAIGSRPPVATRILGFENHAGRTMLGESATALAKVVDGYGNDGRGTKEGCIVNRAIGTYLHGPLLPRNPKVADWLIAAALVNRYGDEAADLVTPIEEPAFTDRARIVSTMRAHAERRN